MICARLNMRDVLQESNKLWDTDSVASAIEIIDLIKYMHTSYCNQMEELITHEYNIERAASADHAL